MRWETIDYLYWRRAVIVIRIFGNRYKSRILRITKWMHWPTLVYDQRYFDDSYLFWFGYHWPNIKPSSQANVDVQIDKIFRSHCLTDINWTTNKEIQFIPICDYLEEALTIVFNLCFWRTLHIRLMTIFCGFLGGEANNVLLWLHIMLSLHVEFDWKISMLR